MTKESSDIIANFCSSRIGIYRSISHNIIGLLPLYQLLHTLILEPFQSEMITKEQISNTVVSAMTIQSSYIFLKKDPESKKYDIDSAGNKILVIEAGHGIYSYIMNLFPGASKEINKDEWFKDKITYMMQATDEFYHVSFNISEVIDTIYLTVQVEGRIKAKIIGCLEQIQDKLLSLAELNERYIPIISYDAISEYYCNKIIPRLNSLERNLRKLLFNIYIVNFGRNYYQATTSEEFQAKIKSVIHARGNKEKKEEERLKLFFYSFEFNDIQTLLFTPGWTSFDENIKKKFLDEHQDLSKLSDDQLRKAFSEFSIKSDWERFFNKKVNIDKIEEVIEDIRRYRNKIAHFKFFTKSEYLHCEQIMRKLNKAIVKAIQITEEKDFNNKNYEYLSDALAEPLMRLAELTHSLSASISPGIKALKQIHDGISNVMQSVNFSALSETMDKLLIALAVANPQDNQLEPTHQEDTKDKEDDDGLSENDGNSGSE